MFDGDDTEQQLFEQQLFEQQPAHSVSQLLYQQPDTPSPQHSSFQQQQQQQGAGGQQENDGGPPRVARACLACRKLKTRCFGNEVGPCRRCASNKLECIYVASQRGKRPPRDPTTGAVLPHPPAGASASTSSGVGVRGTRRPSSEAAASSSRAGSAVPLASSSTQAAQSAAPPALPRASSAAIPANHLAPASLPPPSSSHILSATGITGASVVENERLIAAERALRELQRMLAASSSSAQSSSAPSPSMGGTFLPPTPSTTNNATAGTGVSHEHLAALAAQAHQALIDGLAGAASSTTSSAADVKPFESLQGGAKRLRLSAAQAPASTSASFLGPSTLPSLPISSSAGAPSATVTSHSPPEARSHHGAIERNLAMLADASLAASIDDDSASISEDDDDDASDEDEEVDEAVGDDADAAIDDVDGENGRTSQVSRGRRQRHSGGSGEKGTKKRSPVNARRRARLSFGKHSGDGASAGAGGGGGAGGDPDFKLSTFTKALANGAQQSLRNSSLAGGGGSSLGGAGTRTADGANGSTGAGGSRARSASRRRADAMLEGGQGHGTSDSRPDTQTPALLKNGVISPDMAVDLFRIYFEYAYIHLPILDPERNTARDVAARSPFLFTSICAVASRFAEDGALHIACYDEAHTCFLARVAASGDGRECTLEDVQATMILTLWGCAPKGVGEDRPQRAYLYFGMAIRMALELGLWRPPQWVDEHLLANPGAMNPWQDIKGVSDERQRDALDRERAMLGLFVIDRNISAVMGRPYQVHEAKPMLIPKHPFCRPLDLSLVALQQLQSILSQVIDSFWDRIFGLASASKDMPDAVLMKLFNSRLDEWIKCWCPDASDPISNIFHFRYQTAKLFVNTFPLQTMLRTGEPDSEGADCVQTCIDAAKAILTLGHAYANVGVLRYCPDVNFLLLMYAAVFLIKLKACAPPKFAAQVDAGELQRLVAQCTEDCARAATSPNHSASTCQLMLRALMASWRKLDARRQQHKSKLRGGDAGGGGVKSKTGEQGEQPRAASALDRTLAASAAPSAASSPFPSTPASPAQPSTTAADVSGILSDAMTTTADTTSALNSWLPQAAFDGDASFYADATLGGLGVSPGDNLTAVFGGDPLSNAFSAPGGSAAAGAGGDDDIFSSFLQDSRFLNNNVLLSQGADSFFSWADALDSAQQAAGPPVLLNNSNGTGGEMPPLPWGP